MRKAQEEVNRFPKNSKAIILEDKRFPYETVNISDFPDLEKLTITNWGRNSWGVDRSWPAYHQLYSYGLVGISDIKKSRRERLGSKITTQFNLNVRFLCFAKLLCN